MLCFCLPLLSVLDQSAGVLYLELEPSSSSNSIFSNGEDRILGNAFLRNKVEVIRESRDAGIWPSLAKHSNFHQTFILTTKIKLPILG